jgi:putative membrane-bound dehydrogenase-like protein
MLGAFLCAAFATFLLSLAPEPPADPLSPKDEAASFRLADDHLTIELVAAEPHVISPVAMAWDADGRLYVAEMFDYPLGPQHGRVKLLEATKGTGQYDKVTVFAGQLPFPNSVLPWKGGVLVTAAPDIWHFVDTDGDGKADKKQIILTGFAEGNQQLRANGLTWGLDNWVYAANGRSGGTIRKPGAPATQAIAIPRSDFRFRPDTGDTEAIAGFSQFGLPRDDFGNRFPSWNTTPFRHVVLEERYLKRNPYLASVAGVAATVDPSDPGRVYSISPPPTTFNREPVNFFNASCGNTIYRGDLLPASYHGNEFVCEPLTNLVHRRSLKPNGVTFVATRTEPEKEFLASTDSWFHPVNLATGPDGALYVADFYRQWVEHPDFVPPGLRKKIDWRTGANHGRIWRIYPKSSKPGPVPAMTRASTEGLVNDLGHPNGWRRDTAQRLLVERQDRRAISLLKDVLEKGIQPLARIHALWTLDGLHALSDDSLAIGLSDAHPRVREQALRLAEGRLAQADSLLFRKVMELVHDDDRRVVFQCAATLGELRRGSPHKIRQLSLIAGRYPGDEWTRLAILSSLKDCAWPFLQSLLTRHPGWLKKPSPDQVQFLMAIAALIGTNHTDKELRDCFELITSSLAEGNICILAGLADGLARSGSPLRALSAKPPAGLQQGIRDLGRIFDFTRQVVQDEQATPAIRVAAIYVLAEESGESSSRVLFGLLHPGQPQAVQSAAARSVTRRGDRKLLEEVLEQWHRYTLGTRRQLLDGLARSARTASILVEAIEQDKVPAMELDPAAREALQRIPNADFQKRARKVLSLGTAADRQDVIRKYQSALTLEGDRQRGAAAFAKNCLTCHQLQQQGHHVGPDLSGVASRPKEALLTDILDPSKEVAPDFMNFVVVTRRGQVLTGLIAAETATSVKLRRADGVEDTVLRSEIQELRPSGKSLMPEGLEQSLTVQDVADIMAFLHEAVPLPAVERK